MRKTLLITLVALAIPSVSAAQNFEDNAQVELLPGWRTTDGDHIAAIRITLAPGWITYWRAPGEAGIPPQFEFSSDVAISGITPHWPVPEVFEDAGLQSIGYYNSVIFPLTVQSDAVTGDIPVSGELTIGVCEEVCVPMTFAFDTLLPAVGAEDAAILAALDDVPLTRSEANVGDVTCTIEPISDGLRLTALIDVAQSGATEHVVIEPSNPRVWVSQADVMRDGATLSATVEMVHPSGEPFAFDRSGVRITVLGGGKAIDLSGCSPG